MTPEHVLQEFRDAQALLDGHFVLSSGLHSRNYLQCARVLMDTRRAARLAEALADKLRASIDTEIECVVAPAMGGLIIGHEVARALGVPSMFLERVDGTFTLRRGFELAAQARTVMIEDIVTTGLSSREAIEAIHAHGGQVVGAGCLIDRSAGTANIGVNLESLAQVSFETFEADQVPEDLQDIPAIKPGSRGLK
jgi:orotate phosphoribosyltransferase